MSAQATSSRDAKPVFLLIILYALLAFPIALPGLPLHLHLPQYFANYHGIDLSVLGIILFISRLGDTVFDPFFGRLSDRWVMRGISRIRQIAYALPIMLIGLTMLVFVAQSLAAWWLLAALIIIYAAISWLAVNYYALATDITSDEKALTTFNLAREAAILCGIVIGSAVPPMLVEAYGYETAMMSMILVVGAIIIVVTPVCLLLLSKKIPAMAPSSTPHLPLKEVLRQAWSDQFLRKLYLAYGANALANALPATLILLYIADVLDAAAQAGTLLGVYFLCAIISMPVWGWMASRIGLRNCWVVSVVMAALAFLPAAFLQAGQIDAFLIVTALTGVALGADLAMPATLLSNHVAKASDQAATYFGIYNLLFKLALALAAGAALPLLSSLGYAPGTQNDQAVTTLAFAYALLPVVMKLIAAFAVMRLPR